MRAATAAFRNSAIPAISSATRLSSFPLSLRSRPFHISLTRNQPFLFHLSSAPMTTAAGTSGVSMEKQFEEFRTQLEESGGIRDRIEAVATEMESAARPHAKKKKRSVHQKRIELEKEVEVLRKSLDHEKKVHQVLKRAVLQPNTGSDIKVPSILPIKARELLFEVVMVQNEISRLESMISDIKNETQELRSSNREHSSGTENPHKPSLFCLMRIESQMEEDEQKPWIEIEPPILIHQVVECRCDNWGIASKGRTPLKKVLSRKAPGILMKVIKECEISFDRSPSPMPTPTSSTCRQLECERDAMSSAEDTDLFISRSKENCRKDIQPNKLSEEIMKCLISIFLKLMTTSGEAENDISTANSSLGSGDTRGYVNDRSLSEPKVLKQQDPYDIFQIKGSIVRDIGNYRNLAICTSSTLDMKAIVACVPLLRKLRILRRRLRDVNLNFLTQEEMLAFWINMHNTAIMQGILENGWPANSQDLHALREKAILNIGGIKLSALATEHFILRRLSYLKDVSWKSKNDDNEDLTRAMYRLDHSEPNIIFGLCNGTKSSPSVRIYTAENIHIELEKAKLEYLQASIAVTTTEKLMIPKMLQWNMNDFAKDLGSLVLWICHQLPKSGPLRRSMMVCLKNSDSEDASKLVEIIPYDFGFQLLLPS